MANLIKRKRQWVARISIYDGIKQHFKAIPLRTESKIEARVRFKEVNIEHQKMIYSKDS